MIARRSCVGWSVVVLVLALGVILDAPVLPAQSMPDFAPLDAGGILSNLLEVRPSYLSMGEILPTGSYVVWAAIKKPGQSYLRAGWKRYGPYALTGGRRYVARFEGEVWGVSLGDFVDARFGTLKPTEVQINIENLHSEYVFFVINRASPPGSGPCELVGTYTGGDSEGTVAITLRQTGEQLDGTSKMQPTGDAAFSFPVRGTISNRAVRLSYTSPDGEIFTLTGTASSDCRTLRLTLSFGGESRTFDLVRSTGR